LIGNEGRQNSGWCDAKDCSASRGAALSGCAVKIPVRAFNQGAEDGAKPDLEIEERLRFDSSGWKSLQGRYGESS
jgi:hypothetical protein